MKDLEKSEYRTTVLSRLYTDSCMRHRKDGLVEASAGVVASRAGKGKGRTANR